VVPEVPATPVSESPWTDRARLRGEAYGTPEPLAARAALYQYQDEPLDFNAWVLDVVEQEHTLDERSRVLDVGCGPGAYLTKLRDRHPGIMTIGFDLSAGMARLARDTGSPSAVSDAMQVAARADTFDLVICAHMLYHVPDIGLAARELARVVTRGGVVAIVTNGARHLRELDTLTSDSFRSVTGADWNAPARSAARFVLDDAPDLMAPALRVVHSERMSRTITVPDIAPVVAYVDSERSLFESAIPAGTTWATLLGAFEQHAADAIARDGAFVIHSDVGVLLCRPGR
jgi:SAM-dependent methyltransferase